jgi:hypothetical protein
LYLGLRVSLEEETMEGEEGRRGGGRRDEEEKEHLYGGKIIIQ